MNKIDITVLLHSNNEIRKINADNEWLEALLSGDVTKKKKEPKKVNRAVSNSQVSAVRGS